jgi:hypothetical protein
MGSVSCEIETLKTVGETAYRLHEQAGDSVLYHSPLGLGTMQQVSARGIAFGIFLTSELARKPEFVCFRRLPVSIWPYIALTRTVFGSANMVDAG